jgi:hypothetical protein
VKRSDFPKIFSISVILSLICFSVFIIGHPSY